MVELNRQNISILSVLFLVFSLLSPWFVLVDTLSSDYHKDQDKENDSMSTQTKIKEMYYLDKVVTHSKTEDGKKTFFGIISDTESQSASYTFYEDSLESSSGTTNSIFGYMHGIYKVVLFILVVRLGLLFGDSVLDTNKTLLFTSLTMLLIVILFIFGFKNAYVSTFDATILENDTPNERDTNMTFIAGFGNTSSPNFRTDYVETVETYRYETSRISLPQADLIESGSYFYFNSGANINEYYVWFDKNGDGTSDKPYVTNRIEIVVDLSEFNGQQNQSQEALRDSTYSSIVSNTANAFTLVKEGSSSIILTATTYGETDNINNYNVNGLDWSTQEDGGIDSTEATFYSPLENSVRWNPSIGFVLFFISSLLDFTYRNKD
jgi:hypothetical protein